MRSAPASRPRRPRAAAVLGLALAVAAPAVVAEPDWTARSNEHAQVLVRELSKFQPEAAGRFGVDGLDAEVVDLRPGLDERLRSALVGARSTLQARLASETDPRVRADLEILVQSADQFLESSAAEHDLLLPYVNVSETVFGGLRALLDDQVPEERRGAALVRLRKYAGLEPGHTPITELAANRLRERLPESDLLGPVQAQLERDLMTRARYVDGIAELFRQYGITGWEPAHQKLAADLEAYEAFLRRELVPRARADFRQPPRLYALALRDFGIDMPVDELVSRAQAAFIDIRNEMQALAPLVAREKGLAVTDYRAVFRQLKQEQIVGDAILPHYRQRIADLEAIIARERVVSLPKREMRIRLASAAESAAIPAPNMRPPRMIGNTGEMGEFVLPLRVPGADGADLQFDDFTYAAASWTLTAHEGRPGHELQFAANVEHGVSLARMLFAMNSVNVEGWALYAEAEMKPYEPLDGQLAALQHRLLRAARAFLDPGLQSGTVTADEAMRILRQDVCLSEAMARQEVERYTFRAPGQAPSYFCGYVRLLALRAEAERALGADFDRQRYHDFVLAQGLLPPTLLRKAVLEEFVPQQKNVASRKAASGG